MRIATLVSTLVLTACSSTSGPSWRSSDASSSGCDASSTSSLASSGDAMGGSSEGGTFGEGATAGTTTGGSGESTGEPSEDAPSFASDVWPILAARCSCHQGASAPAELVMSSASVAYDNLVEIASTRESGDRVVPFEAEDSVLWRRVSSTTPGYRMPLSGSALSAAQQAVIRAWIEGGAQP